MKIIVGGKFDSAGGRKSSIVASLFESLGPDWDCINGGDLSVITSFDPTGVSVLIWMPDVSNDEDKIIDTLKLRNPRMILIQSKRVIEKEYTESDIVGRLLKSHSLMGIMITKPAERFNFKLLDPLGNQWANTESIKDVGIAIRERIDYLSKLTRVGSVPSLSQEQFVVPPEFIDVVKNYGTEFTKFVNAVNPNRLLGNASTRCAKGFPVIRMNDRLLVTRRNVDKTTLSEDDFVLVEQTVTDRIRYAGTNKPSVDTPIQIKLFSYYKNVQFMIHGHAYIKDGKFTRSKVPCGFLEEFDEIVELYPDPDATDFAVNLKGHGCLVLANSLEYLEKRLPDLYSRPFPEE